MSEPTPVVSSEHTRPVQSSLSDSPQADRPSSAPGQQQQPHLADLPSVLQKVVAERDALRAQNDQLWKIIEKQRTAIQQLQKKALDKSDPSTLQGPRKSSYSEGMPLQASSSSSAAAAAATPSSTLPSTSSILPPMAITEVQSSPSHSRIPTPLDLSSHTLQDGVQRKKSASTSSLVDSKGPHSSGPILTLAEPTPTHPPPDMLVQAPHPPPSSRSPSPSGTPRKPRALPALPTGPNVRSRSSSPSDPARPSNLNPLPPTHSSPTHPPFLPQETPPSALRMGRFQTQPVLGSSSNPSSSSSHGPTDDPALAQGYPKPPYHHSSRHERTTSASSTSSFVSLPPQPIYSGGPMTQMTPSTHPDAPPPIDPNTPPSPRPARHPPRAPPQPLAQHEFTGGPISRNFPRGVNLRDDPRTDSMVVETGSEDLENKRLSKMTIPGSLLERMDTVAAQLEKSNGEPEEEEEVEEEVEEDHSISPSPEINRLPPSTAPQSMPSSEHYLSHPSQDSPQPNVTLNENDLVINSTSSPQDSLEKPCQDTLNDPPTESPNSPSQDHLEEPHASQSPTRHSLSNLSQATHRQGTSPNLHPSSPSSISSSSSSSLPLVQPVVKGTGTIFGPPLRTLEGVRARVVSSGWRQVREGGKEVAVVILSIRHRRRSSHLHPPVMERIPGHARDPSEDPVVPISPTLSDSTPLSPITEEDAQDDTEEEMWRVEKGYAEFSSLESRIKSAHGRGVSWRVGKSPDKSLFSGASPQKVDGRKAAVAQWMDRVLISVPPESNEVIKFLSTSIVRLPSIPSSEDLNSSNPPIPSSASTTAITTSPSSSSSSSSASTTSSSTPSMNTTTTITTSSSPPSQTTYPGANRLSHTPSANAHGSDSTTVIEGPILHEPSKYREGYLTKRGKNFGGWKTRYFILRSSTLEYYDTRGGSRLGEIQLDRCQVAKQQSSSSSSSSSSNAISSTASSHSLSSPTGAGGGQGFSSTSTSSSSSHPIESSGSSSNSPYRHALMILEPRGKKEIHRHVLCAESDEERDAWVASLSLYVNHGRPIPVSPPHSKTSGQEMESMGQGHPMAQAGSAQQGSAPPPLVSTGDSSPARSGGPNHTYSSSHVSIGSTVPSGVVRSSSSSSYTFGSGQGPQASKPPPALSKKEAKEQAKREEKERKVAAKRESQFQGKKKEDGGGGGGFWGRKMFGGGGNGGSGTGHSSAASRIVFGRSLEEAIAVASVRPDYPCPAVVYRCIQYLEDKQAELEEGIYRLSGSSSVIKKLKEKFDQVGDYNLLATGEYHDVHAVAGLLKLYLRELPQSVLTPQLHVDFLRVLSGKKARRERVNELGRLVSELPLPNYTLLRALISHLLRVVSNSSVNKMTASNVGIVFSPTLNLPAGLFHLLMAEFDYVFFVTDDGTAAPVMLDSDDEEEEEGRGGDGVMTKRSDVRASTGAAPHPTTGPPRASLEDTPNHTGSGSNAPPNETEASSSPRPQETTRYSSGLRARGVSGGMGGSSARTNRNSMIYASVAPEMVQRERGLSQSMPQGSGLESTALEDRDEEDEERIMEEEEGNITMEMVEGMDDEYQGGEGEEGEWSGEWMAEDVSTPYEESMGQYDEAHGSPAMDPNASYTDERSSSSGGGLDRLEGLVEEVDGDAHGQEQGQPQNGTYAPHPQHRYQNYAPGQGHEAHSTGSSAPLPPPRGQPPPSYYRPSNY
ncbi:MAG: hypothetical protein DHS80DRAFT_28955 [Piptocephalis tieghemiana]|nr:MAG: hypothetical protein DHS80DRAFT_28955 [Piptocephalis tieghemiana]